MLRLVPSDDATRKTDAILSIALRIHQLARRLEILAIHCVDEGSIDLGYLGGHDVPPASEERGVRLFECEGKEFVVAAALHRPGPRVARAPIDRPVDNRRARIHRTTGRPRPEDLPGRPIQCVKLVPALRHGRGIDDAVRRRYGCEVPYAYRLVSHHLRLWIRCLPDDLAGLRVEGGPRTTSGHGVRQGAVPRQPVRDVVLVRNRHVDPVAVISRAPLHPTHVTARPDERIPDEISGLRVEDDVDAALFPNADDRALVPAVANLEDVRTGTTEVPFVATMQGVVGRRGAPGDLRRLRPARSLPGGVSYHAVRPDRDAGMQVERDD